MALIRGTVVDGAGRPVEMASVYFISAPQPQPDVAQLSGPDGAFVLAVRAPGTYVLGARSDVAGEGTATFEARGDEEIAVRLSLQRSA